MTQPTTTGSEYLQRLIRHLAGQPVVTALYAGGALAGGGGDPFAELELYAVAPGGLGLSLTEFVASAGETAYAGECGETCRAVTPDGLAITLSVVPSGAGIEATGLQTLLDRTPDGPAPVGPAVSRPLPDLAAAAAAFWHDLWVATAAVGQGQPLTAHGRLEACRTSLVDLYRLALAPGRPGAGYEGAEALPGAVALDQLREWLVTPLDLREQWRCATRLASAYESLMLPLVERLGLTYPWAMRNLAFARLDQVRPDRSPTGQPDVPRLRDTERTDEPSPKPAGPAKFKVKLRRPRGDD
jgi:hypothetical protein